MTLITFLDYFLDNPEHVVAVSLLMLIFFGGTISLVRLILRKDSNNEAIRDLTKQLNESSEKLKNSVDENSQSQSTKL